PFPTRRSSALGRPRWQGRQREPSRAAPTRARRPGRCPPLLTRRRGVDHARLTGWPAGRGVVRPREPARRRARAPRQRTWPRCVVRRDWSYLNTVPVGVQARRFGGSVRGVEVLRFQPYRDLSVRLVTSRPEVVQG